MGEPSCLIKTFFFSDLTKFEIIRLSQENKDKFKKGDEDAFKLVINRGKKSSNYPIWRPVAFAQMPKQINYFR